jgi:hypothetical protein
LPAGDILIHVGNLTLFSESMDEITNFNKWLGELPHRHKIVVPGNHESFPEADPSRRSLLSNAIVLIDEGIVIDGLWIWGTPVTPMQNGAFVLSSPNCRAVLKSELPHSRCRVDYKLHS